MILYSSAGGSSSHQPHRGLPSSPTSMLSRHTLCSATSLCTVAPHLRVSRKHVEPAANLAPPHTCQAPPSPKSVHVASTSPDGDTSRSPGSYLPSVISGIMLPPAISQADCLPPSQKRRMYSLGLRA